MQKIVMTLSMIGLVFSSTLVYAADTGFAFTKKYPTSYGPVVFNHQAHATRRVEECSHCHAALETYGGKISQSYAHNYCQTCHEAKNGPTDCTGCHDGTQISKK